MSDGALSQDEIDSLLAGLDPSAGGGAKAPSGGGASGPGPELAALRDMLDSIGGTQAQNLSMITGQDVSFGPLQAETTTRDGILPILPDEVLAIHVDMIGAIPGDHIFILPKDTAIRIASLANKDDSLSELDDMAISAVSECVSSITGTQITLFSEKTGNQSIQSEAADGAFGPKAIARFPAGDFAKLSYQLSIGGQSYSMWEIYASSFVRDIAAASGLRAPEAARPGAMNPQGGMMGAQGGMMGGMGGMMGGGMPPMQQQQASMGMMGGMMGGFQQPMGMPQGYGSPVMGMAPPNVQPVQFANLNMGQGFQESGNIGLIMDVYMELTVELGRTKRLIKDILGIGEGTIIELDKLAGEPVDILVNHKLIAKGEVVVIDENFGVRVTEIVSPMERMAELS